MHRKKAWFSNCVNEVHFHFRSLCGCRPQPARFSESEKGTLGKSCEWRSAGLTATPSASWTRGFLSNIHVIQPDYKVMMNVLILNFIYPANAFCHFSFQSDINKINNAIADQVSIFIERLSTFIFGFLVGFIGGWKLTLVVIAVSPLIGLAAGLMAMVGITADQFSWMYLHFFCCLSSTEFFRRSILQCLVISWCRYFDTNVCCRSLSSDKACACVFWCVGRGEADGPWVEGVRESRRSRRWSSLIHQNSGCIWRRADGDGEVQSCVPSGPEISINTMFNNKMIFIYSSARGHHL